MRTVYSSKADRKLKVPADCRRSAPRQRLTKAPDRQSLSSRGPQAHMSLARRYPAVVSECMPGGDIFHCRETDSLEFVQSDEMLCSRSSGEPPSRSRESTPK